MKRLTIAALSLILSASALIAAPSIQGATRIDGALGANFVLPNPKHRLALEPQMPIEQDLDGPQLEKDWQLILRYPVNVRRSPMAVVFLRSNVP